MSTVSDDELEDRRQPLISHMDQAVILSEDEKTSGRVGDVRYAAPEVVSLRPYSFKADIWALGVLLFFMVTKSLPFDDSIIDSDSSSSLQSSSEKSGKPFDFNEMEDKIRNIEPNFKLIDKSKYSQVVIDLLKRLLNKNEMQRFTAKSLLKHEWFFMTLVHKETQKEESEPKA